MQGSLERKVVHTRRVYSARFLRSKPWLVSGEDSGLITITDLESGEIVRTFKHHRHVVRDLAISLDDSAIFAASWDSTASVIPISTITSTTPHHGNAAAINTSSPIIKLVGHEDMVTSIIALHDGETCVTGSDDMSIRVWTAKTGHCRHVLDTHSAAVTCLALHSSGKVFASGSDDKTAVVWDCSTFQSLRVVSCANFVRVLAFSNDSDLLLVAVHSTTVLAYDHHNEQEISSFGSARECEGPLLGLDYGKNRLKHGSWKCLRRHCG